MDGWMDGYPLDCYDHWSTCGANNKHHKREKCQNSIRLFHRILMQRIVKIFFKVHFWRKVAEQITYCNLKLLLLLHEIMGVLVVMIKPQHSIFSIQFSCSIQCDLNLGNFMSFGQKSPRIRIYRQSRKCRRKQSALYGFCKSCPSNLANLPSLPKWFLILASCSLSKQFIYI